MIDNSLAKVEAGSKISGETAEALGKIVSGVTDTVNIVATIAEASEKQAESIAQIENGVGQISQVTQTNTATAEESASASEEMAGQAQMLEAMISEFTLHGQKSKALKLQGSARERSKAAAGGKNPSAYKQQEMSLEEDFAGPGGSRDDQFDEDFGKY